MRLKFLCTALAFAILCCQIMCPVSADALSSMYIVSSEYAESVYYDRLCDVTLTGEAQDDLFNVAFSQLGYHEGNYAGNSTRENNVTEYNYWYFGRYVSGDNYAWCTTFLAWCARQARINPSVLPSFPRCVTAYNSILPNVGCAMNRATSDYVPVRGDLIFLGTSSSNIYHVGIVDYSDGTSVFYISGNDDEAVVYRQKSLRDTKIYGYATPKYSFSDIEYMEVFGGFPEPERDLYFLNDGVFYGDDVRWVQHCLLNLSYEITVDGYFGEQTEACVKLFQSQHSLAADGIVGAVTRSCIKLWTIANATELGDVNLDLSLNTGDAAYMLQAVAGLFELMPAELSVADYNGDLSFNSGDAAAILMHVAQLEPEAQP